VYCAGKYNNEPAWWLNDGTPSPLGITGTLSAFTLVFK
jgi:hypothetical protein